MHVSKGQDNVSDDHSETAIVTFPERHEGGMVYAEDTGRKSIKSLVMDSTEKQKRTYFNTTDPEEGKNPCEEPSGKMLYL